MASKKKDKIDPETIEVQGLEDRLRAGKLTDADVDSLLKIISLVQTLRTLLQKRSLGLLSLLRKLFSIKTEKHDVPEKSKNENIQPRSGRQGRYGRDGYPGAEKIDVKHPDLSPRQKCPECKKGRLSEVEPAVDYAWQGQAPLKLDIYLLQRLLCPDCKTYFTAPSPSAGLAHTVDDSQDEVKTGIIDANASANAMVAGLRFEFGVPHYRLAKIQERRGLALPPANQDRMIKQVALSAAPVFDELVKLAADGDLLHSDDTRMKVLNHLKNREDPPLKKTQTTVIISRNKGYEITLHVTGTDQAGANVSKVLANRSDGLPPPIHMCDGLAANKVSEDVVVANCLDHGRRKFFEIKTSFTEECDYVLDEMQKVYRFDKETRAMTPKGRLEYHAKHSGPVMESLRLWMKDQLEWKKAEPNSPLGKAISYNLKRWKELTTFLRVEGAPLSNAEAERSIKWAICHRKNSLFYKTMNGAKQGDIIQSMIRTCNQAGINSFDYLVALRENRSKVYEAPELWLPWNYRISL